MSSNEKKTNLRIEKKKEKSTFLVVGTIVIFVLATVSFILLPAIVRDDSSSYPPFGSYKGKKIELKNGSEFSEYVSFYIEQAGKSNNPLITLQAFNKAFNNYVVSLAYEDNIKETNYTIPDTLLTRNLYHYFTDASGNYSAKIYNETPNAQKTKIYNNVKKNLINARYTQDYLGTYGGKRTIGGLKQSSGEIPFIADMGTKTRVFDIVAFSVSDYPETETTKFGLDNKELFVTYNYEVLTFDKETKAKEILGQIKNNEIVFEDALKDEKISTKLYGTDGKFENKYYYQFMSDFQEDELTAVKNLKADEISDVVAIKGGSFAIFRCTKNPSEPDFTNDALVKDVFTYLLNNKRSVVETYFENQAKDFKMKALGAGFDEVCESLGKEKVTTEPFPLNYGNDEMIERISANSILSGAEKNENFLKTAFSLKLNEISSPIVINNNVIVLKLVEEQLADAEAIKKDLDLSYENTIYNYRLNMINSAIINSPDVKNNVTDVVFKNILNY